MNAYLNFSVLSLCVMLVSACDLPSESKGAPAARPRSLNNNESIIMGSITGVPTAESVFPNAPAAPPPPLSGRPSGRMTKDQESRGMPVPGQNNDHSAPKASDKP